MAQFGRSFPVQPIISRPNVLEGVWGPPQNLQATAISDDQIDLTWTAVPGASGYDIERDGTVIVLDHATTSYSDTGLNPSTEYDYRIRAVG